jgi:hypothetical protein
MNKWFFVYYVEDDTDGRTVHRNAIINLDLDTIQGLLDLKKELQKNGSSAAIKFYREIKVPDGFDETVLDQQI